MRSTPLRLRFPLIALLALVATAAAAAGPPSHAAPPALDEGTFAISVGGEKLGTEQFTFRVLRDSLCLVSQSKMIQDDGSGHRDSVSKAVFMAVDKDDYMLHVYQSSMGYRGQTTVRAIVIVPGDTVFTLYREYNGHGTGDRLVLPPGRMYVMDSRLFALVEFITLSVHEQSFDQRPVNLLTLGERDTMVEATLARVGRDTLRSAGRVVNATHMRLIQGPVTFELWVDPRGRLLRLSHPPTGMLVDRVAAGAAVRTPAKHPGG